MIQRIRRSLKKWYVLNTSSSLLSPWQHHCEPTWKILKDRTIACYMNELLFFRIRHRWLKYSRRLIINPVPNLFVWTLFFLWHWFIRIIRWRLICRSLWGIDSRLICFIWKPNIACPWILENKCSACSDMMAWKTNNLLINYTADGNILYFWTFVVNDVIAITQWLVLSILVSRGQQGRPSPKDQSPCRHFCGTVKGKYSEQTT